MVSSESAVRWRRASSHQRRKSSSLGWLPVVASCRSSSSIVGSRSRIVVRRAGRSRYGLLILEALVGFDDALHQRVAYHVLGLEVGEADAGHILQNLDDMGQTGFGAARQVDLGDVAGDHCGGTEADAR